jgi:hypothetical protein
VTVPGLGPDLGFTGRDVGADHLVRHVDHAVLVDQSAEDPLHRVPLLARRVEIRAQDLLDHRLEPIQLRRPPRPASSAPPTRPRPAP